MNSKSSIKSIYLSMFIGGTKNNCFIVMYLQHSPPNGASLAHCSPQSREWSEMDFSPLVFHYPLLA